MSLTLALILALTVKHFLCDFPLQADPWLYGNKGKYGHPGGITHATIHLAGTLIALDVCGVTWPAVSVLALADGLIHYHIDFAKMRLNAHFGLKPDNSEWFWILLGFDQLLHGLTYIAIVWWVTEWA